MWTCIRIPIAKAMYVRTEETEEWSIYSLGLARNGGWKRTTYEFGLTGV